MANEPQGHKIFVGGLRDVEEDEFVEAFRRYGDVITWNFQSGRNFAFVSYRQEVDAANAIEDMHNMYLGYQRMRVEWADDYCPSPIVLEETTDDYERVFNMTCENNCSVHCKGLTSFTTEETLQRIFSPFGEIEEICLFTHRSDYAFINFNSKEAATLAICSINNTEIDGSLVKCSWSYRPDYRNDRFMFALSTSTESSSSTSRSSSPSLYSGDEFERISNETTPNNRTVYCGGLVPSVTNALMEEIFSPFGIVESITLFNDRLGYGFVRFNTKEAATLAICSINGTLIEGCPVRCSWSRREGISTLLQEASESSLESISTAISHLSDRLDRSSTQFDFGAAAASAPLTVDESQEAAKPKERKTALLCKICMDEELGIVFLPCGHLTSCAKCAQQISTCPVCRRIITRKVRTYLS